MSSRWVSSGGLGGALALLCLLWPTTALGHHILGIPHYKYGEDYPQIPYLEVVAQIGEQELVFTHFPGFPKPDEDVRFKLYVRNRTSGEVFQQPLHVEVMRRRFLRAAEPAGKPFEIRPGTGPEANDYKFFLTFREAEAYEVRVSFPTADGFEVVPFPVTIGETDDRPLVLGAAGLLALTVVFVAVSKKRRRRRRSSKIHRAVPRDAGSAA